MISSAAQLWEAVDLSSLSHTFETCQRGHLSNTKHLIPDLMKRISVGTLIVAWYLSRITGDRFWLTLDHFSIVPRNRFLALALALDPWLIETINLQSSNTLDQCAETSIAVLVNGRIINDSEILSRRVFGAGGRPWRGRRKRVESRWWRF
jgi:hypothetical protein